MKSSSMLQMVLLAMAAAITVAASGCADADSAMLDIFDKVQVGAPVDESQLGPHMLKSPLGWTWDDFSQAQEGKILRVVVNEKRIVAKRYVKGKRTNLGLLKTSEFVSVMEVEIPPEYFHPPSENWEYVPVLDMFLGIFEAAGVGIAAAAFDGDSLSKDPTPTPTSGPTSSPVKSEEQKREEALNDVREGLTSILRPLPLSMDYSLALKQFEDKAFPLGIPASKPTSFSDEEGKVTKFEKCVPEYLQFMLDITRKQNSHFIPLFFDRLKSKEDDLDDFKKEGKTTLFSLMTLKLSFLILAPQYSAKDFYNVEKPDFNYEDLGWGKKVSIKHLGGRIFRVEATASITQLSFFGLEDKN